MAQVQLTLDSLGDLDDGAGRIAINGALAEAVKDLDERGEDGKAREVTIKVTLEQMAKSRNITIDVQAAVKMPSYKINPTIAEIRVGQKGKKVAVFQQHAPDDPAQTTID